MKFVTMTELNALCAEADKTLKRLNTIESVDARVAHCISLAQIFDYYLISGADGMAVVEGVSVNQHGFYLAIRCKFTGDDSYRSLTGNLNDENFAGPSLASSTLAMIHQDYHRDIRHEAA